MTKSLNELHIALYEFLLSVSLDHVLDRVILGSRVHALVCSLLMAKCRVSNRIRHILDITIPMGKILCLAPVLFDVSSYPSQSTRRCGEVIRSL